MHESWKPCVVYPGSWEWVGGNRESVPWLASVNQFIIAHAGSETAPFVLRVGMTGGPPSRLMKFSDPVDVKSCDLGGGSERDGVPIDG